MKAMAVLIIPPVLNVIRALLSGQDEVQNTVAEGNKNVQQ